MTALSMSKQQFSRLDVLLRAFGTTGAGAAVAQTVSVRRWPALNTHTAVGRLWCVRGDGDLICRPTTDPSAVGPARPGARQYFPLARRLRWCA